MLLTGQSGIEYWLGQNILPVQISQVVQTASSKMGGKAFSHQDSFADHPARSSVGIPTELHRPYIYIYIHLINLTSRPYVH